MIKQQFIFLYLSIIIRRRRVDPLPETIDDVFATDLVFAVDVGAEDDLVLDDFLAEAALVVFGRGVDDLNVLASSCHALEQLNKIGFENKFTNVLLCRH
jgi:hypothetical protein